ncbi:MAG: hypothetical protein JOZ41_14155 [Chloroflexi bacterium]|nr:hypothetical protein [Chloroflexota bacterium]
MTTDEYRASDQARTGAGGMGWPTVIVVSAVAVAAASILQVAPPLRPVAAFWFLLVCPGMAFVPLLPVRDGLIQLGLAVAMSIGLDGAVSEAMLYTRTWSPGGELAVLIGVALIGALLQAGRVLRGRAGQTPANRPAANGDPG